MDDLGLRLFYVLTGALVLIFLIFIVPKRLKELKALRLDELSLWEDLPPAIGLRDLTDEKNCVVLRKQWFFGRICFLPQRVTPEELAATLSDKKEESGSIRKEAPKVG